MKIVINCDFGGFGLSDEAVELIFQYKGWKMVKQDTCFDLALFYRDSIESGNLFDERAIERNDTELVRVVEELGDRANTKYSRLKVVEIPDDVKWGISDYDGQEHVFEEHRVWY